MKKSIENKENLFLESSAGHTIDYDYEHEHEHDEGRNGIQRTSTILCRCGGAKGLTQH